MNLEKIKKERDYRKLFGAEPLDTASAAWSDLEESRAALPSKMDALLTKVETEARDLTPEEERAFEMADTLLADIKEEMHKRELLNTEQPIERKGHYALHITANQDEDSGNQDRKMGGLIGRSYRDLFLGGAKGKLDRAGFKNNEEFFQCVASGRWDPRLATRTAVSNVGSLGGYAVPDNLADNIYQVALEQSIVLPRARVFPIQYGNSIAIPQFDGFNNATGLFGGFNGQWLAEEQTATPQDATLAVLQIDAKKLAIFLSASNEVISDSMSLETALESAMTNAVSFLLDEAFINGNGIGKPLGALNDPSSISINRAAAGAISLADLTGMYARLHPACQKSAVWVVSPSTVPQLCAMSNTGGHPVFVINASQGVPGTIFGLPILVSEKLAQLGSAGDVMLVDFSQYAVVMRKEIAIERSNAPHWSQDLMDYRCMVRANGHALWKDAVIPRNGTDTLSWCISLSA